MAKIVKTVARTHGRQETGARVLVPKSGFARDVFYEDPNRAVLDVQSKLQDLDSRSAALEAGAPTSGGSIGILHTQTGVDMQAGGTLGYTVPVGKTLILKEVVLRDVSATLAGGTDYDISDGTTDWLSTQNFSTVLDNSVFRLIAPSNNLPVFAAGQTLQLDANVGSTGAATATFDLIGYLV